MNVHSILQLAAAAAMVTGLLLSTGNAQAAVPSTLTHQGRLFDANDAPVTATLDVVFALYDSEDPAATPLWTETHSVSFDNGYFSVNLGELTPIGASVFDGSVRYLGITVGDDAEMTPRSATRSVPYALLAGDVNGHIHPMSVSIPGAGVVIDQNGKWVGDPTGLVGPAGADGAVGPAGPAGPMGPAGPAGADCASCSLSAMTGVQRTCDAGISAGSGLQTFDGTAWGTCVASVLAPCAPGVVELCYTGTPATLSVGACKPGLKTCNAQGTGYGPCVGQALPAASDVCGNNVDDDCNGVVDQGCILANCNAIKIANPGSASGIYTIDPDGGGAIPPLQVYCNMTDHGGGWTLVLKAGLNVDLTTPDRAGDYFPYPVDLTPPANGQFQKLNDTLINAIRTNNPGQIGYWVTTPGSGTGLHGAEIFHRADCTFKMNQNQTQVQATTCNNWTITFSAVSPAWKPGFHWNGSDTPSYGWAFGYENTSTCNNNGSALGAHASHYAPFHRGHCNTQAWGIVYVK